MVTSFLTGHCLPVHPIVYFFSLRFLLLGKSSHYFIADIEYRLIQSRFMNILIDFSHAERGPVIACFQDIGWIHI